MKELFLLLDTSAGVLL